MKWGKECRFWGAGGRVVDAEGMAASTDQRLYNSDIHKIGDDLWHEVCTSPQHMYSKHHAILRRSRGCGMQPMLPDRGSGAPVQSTGLAGLEALLPTAVQTQTCEVALGK